ncbi:TPR-like protein [Annulohypoxylon truncatum]|uniref:TPR-like protein n=1 Tax=Annulohypoxylon truncatum TaxID=327061 RepID=UPI002008B095|nr:TPR-like protein [Annulohypoxylon truncatum]KAI1211995.1 TPR-like protein [Annulohypoxylon truncatum]
MAGHGLHVLFDSSEDSPDHAVAEIDIVAVHGLNFRNNPNHARDTWTAGGNLWLQDFLPSKLTKPARVMLFSYNSSPAMDAAAIKLDDHAKTLLQLLNIERENAPQRPLVFVCHSLGGLVVKEALVEANLDTTCKCIIEATRLLVFFATPHRGGNYAGIGEVVAKIFRVGSRKPNNKLLDALKKNSDDATKRFEQSRHLYEHCLVVNFFEGESYGNLGIIVDRASATLGLPGSREKQVATHADHSSICKFDSINSLACRLVLGTIVKEVDRALEIEPRNVHWLVPRSVNSMFTGRRNLITKIKKVLVSPAPRAQRRFVLTGMGGQGKSEVCLKVADELREQFWGVFWVDVSSDSTAKSGLVAIAKLLGSNGTEVDDARRQLSNVDPKHPWLLILDNADNPKVDYQQYFPTGTRGAVLITSRNPECQNYAPDGYEDLGSLDKQDCIHLLLQAAKLASESPTVKSNAENVLEILGSHTLAILQAGAYIAQGACTLSEYPGVFQTQKERLLRFNLTQDQSRYHNIYATLEASAELLGTLQSECAQDSLCLLQVLSPLHYEKIPLDLFKGSWTGAQNVQKYPGDKISDLTNEHVSQLPDFLEPHSHTWDAFRMSEAVNLLESLALIRKSNTDGKLTVSMHPLIHSWINLRQDAIQRDESLFKSQCIIALSRYYQPYWEPYQYHIGLHILSVLQRSSLTHGGLRDSLLPVYVRIGQLLDELRYDQKLEELLQYLFSELRIDDDNMSERFLPIFDLSARNARTRGNIKRSVKLFEQIVRIGRTMYDETHPARLASQHELAYAYLENGQTKQAINLLEQVVKVRETTLDKTHPDRLASQHELAHAYLENGQTKQAINLSEQVVKVRETTLDEMHPSRLASQHGLAHAYLENGQTKQAINLLEQVVKVRETTLDEMHPSRLASQHELASAYLENGQTEQAVDLFEYVVQIQETTLDKTHPDRLASQHELARAYLQNGQIEQAIDLFQHVVQIRETTLDATHPLRLISECRLAEARLAYAEIDGSHHASTPSTSVESPVPQKSRR